MKKIGKRNQIIITALALLIAVAGYISFANKEISIIDEKGEPFQDAVQTMGTDAEDQTKDGVKVEDPMAEGVNADDLADVAMDDAVISAPLEDEIGEAVLTNAGVATSDAIVNAKLNREQTRAKSQDLLMGIVNQEGLDDASKQGALDELVSMTKTMEKESACEQQLMAKGFTDSVVLINGDCVDVTVNRTELTDMERAQIEDIVTRKAECDISKIVINTVN